jgi:hypothetical protein
LDSDKSSEGQKKESSLRIRSLRIFGTTLVLNNEIDKHVTDFTIQPFEKNLTEPMELM